MTVQEKYLKIADDVIAAGPYKPDWHSLAAYEAPKWFRNAKFGIFIHWGIFSVPAHNNEWYSRNMYIQDMEEWEWHRKNFGEHTKFGYKDFIPMFTAPKFDPKQWAKLFKKPVQSMLCRSQSIMTDFRCMIPRSAIGQA